MKKMKNRFFFMNFNRSLLFVDDTIELYNKVIALHSTQHI